MCDPRYRATMGAAHFEIVDMTLDSGSGRMCLLLEPADMYSQVKGLRGGITLKTGICDPSFRSVMCHPGDCVYTKYRSGG